MPGGWLRLCLEEPEGSNEPIAVPSAAFQLLLVILAELTRGNAMRVILHHAERSTGEAAELLNVLGRFPRSPLARRRPSRGRQSWGEIGKNRRAAIVGAGVTRRVGPIGTGGGSSAMDWRLRCAQPAAAPAVAFNAR